MHIIDDNDKKKIIFIMYQIKFWIIIRIKNIKFKQRKIMLI